MTTHSIDVDALIKLAIVAGVGYVAIKYVLPLLSGVDAARDSVANVIGDAIAAATLPGKIDVKSGVVFPDGKRVSLNAILASGTYLDQNQRFTWQKANYQLIAPRRADGWFNAKRI